MSRYKDVFKRLRGEGPSYMMYTGGPNEGEAAEGAYLTPPSEGPKGVEVETILPEIDATDVQPLNMKAKKKRAK